jgi:hypothetical protein
MFPLMTPTRYLLLGLAIALAVMTLLLFGANARAKQFRAELETCAANHKAFVSLTKSAGDLAKVKAQAVELKNEIIVEQTHTGWAAAVASVRTDANRERLRLAASGNSSGGGVSAPTADRPFNAGADPNAIPAPARVAQDCAETTVTANYLQSYIEKVEAR